MKAKKDLVLRQVADLWVVLPLSASCLDFDDLLTLNESGCLLWRLLEQGCREEALVSALTEEYEVSEQTARRDVAAFLLRLEQAGYLEADT